VKARLSKEMMSGGYIRISPDLAVEVLSPNDLAYEVDQKVEEYFSVGVRLIWVINPEKRTVIVYRPDGTATKLSEKDTLEGEEVLPGFSCSISAFFPDPTKLEALGLA
jgi:Uma2 family endonuclease